MKNLLMIRTITLHKLTARFVAIVLFAALLSAAPFHAAFAQTAPALGSAESFAILGGPAVTCTDSTIIGDVGSGLTGSAITQTNCTINGTVHQGDATAIAAYNGFLSAYDALALEPCTGSLDTAYTDATLTLLPGVYCNDAAVTFTRTVLTLDAQNDPNAVWIFKIGTLGTGALTGTSLSVVMANGGQPCNVYWWVAEAATMTTSNFKGNILAGAATTFTGGSLIGRALAQAGLTMTGLDAFGCSSLVPPPAVCKDFVTGGGWIMLPNGGKGTFGVTGGIKHGDFWGHLTYVDHGSKDSKGKKMKVKGTGVTAYTVVDATTRHIEGTAEINGKAGYTYEVDVKDSGEPGRNDMFSLRLSNGYTASGDLAGGNVQLHKKCRPLICVQSDKKDDDEGEGHEDHDGWR